MRIRGQAVSINCGTKETEIELPSVDISKIKKGDEVWAKLENIIILATSNGMVIKGSGYRIYEPKIIAHFPKEEFKLELAKMTQVASLELSKELWEKELRIETEKWHILIGVTNDDKPMWVVDNLKDYDKYLNREKYPAPSTDELLAVMPHEIYAKDGEMGLLAMRKGEVRYDFPNGSKVEYGLNLPEALGKMIFRLLDNGYKYEEKEKCLKWI